VSFISAQDKINDLLSLGPANGGTQDKFIKISAGQASTPLRINFGGARDQETPKILVIFGGLTPYVLWRDQGGIVGENKIPLFL
jgi:hypothetical protein